MPGARDPRYVLARSVLLDALDALGDQRNAVIVVGAQAVYLHTGATDMAVPELTLDADITRDPALLHEVPEIEAAMLGAGFVRGNTVGVWIASRSMAGVPALVDVDLMVPECLMRWAVPEGGRPGCMATRRRSHARRAVSRRRSSIRQWSRSVLWMLWICGPFLWPSLALLPS